MMKFLRTILLVDLLQGLWVTFRNQKPSLVYTEQYPKERPAVAERYRGAPRLNVHPDSNETLCIACNLCALACPELFSDRSARRQSDRWRPTRTPVRCSCPLEPEQRQLRTLRSGRGILRPR